MSALAPIVRTFDAVVDDVADRTIVARVNTNGLDRFNSVLDPKGANLDTYRRNSVLLWEHGKDPRRFTDPIGRAVWIRTNGGPNPTEILAKFRFLDDAFSDERYRWYKDGTLNAFSVRAVPLSYRQPTREEIRARPELDNDRANETRGAFFGPLIYDSWDVAEVSGTAVPGNADCMVVRRAATLLGLADEGRLWLPDDIRPAIEERARAVVNVPLEVDRTTADSQGGLSGGGATVKPEAKGEPRDDDDEDEGDDDEPDPDDPDEEEEGEEEEQGPPARRRDAPGGVARRIVKKNGKYFVYSEDGSKRLGGPYGSRQAAAKRLGQIEYFKHKDEGGRSAPGPGPGPSRDPDDPVRHDGRGGWTIRGLDGPSFPDEASARRALEQLGHPASFDALFRAQAEQLDRRNAAIRGAVEAEVRAIIELQRWGIV